MKLAVWIGLVVCAALIAVRYGQSCMSLIFGGVHFRGTPVDFGIPPKRFGVLGFASWDNPEPWRPGTTYLYDVAAADSGPLNDDARQKEQDELIGAAKVAEDRGDYSGAKKDYEVLRTKNLGDPNFVEERLELIDAVRGQVDPQGLHDFLAATRLPATGSLPSADRVAAEIKPFVAYRQAAALFDAGNLDEAQRLYAECAKSYLGTKRGEAAAIMAVRAALMSHDKKDPQRTPDQLSALSKEIQGFLSDYPESRFTANAEGWQARIAYLQGDYANAANRYSATASNASDLKTKIGACDSLILCYKALGRPDAVAIAWLRRFRVSRGPETALYSADQFGVALAALKPEEAKSFRSALTDDPALMSAYIQIRLELTQPSKEERAGVLELAEQTLTRHPDAANKANLLARVAQIRYLADEIPAAREEAAKAVAAAPPGSDDWALAEYVSAAADKRLGKDSDAISGYQSLIATCPKSYLTPGARESLAFLYDREGRLDKALEMYEKLDYSDDIAYLLDAKMSPNQIASLISGHRDAPNRKLWIFSVGLRYLRIGDLDNADRYFKMLSIAERAEFWKKGVDADSFADNKPLVQDPIRTSADLRRFRSDIAKAAPGEARAAALYKLASYYYERRGLLFYNAALWQGGRATTIGWSWNDSTASPTDDEALREHHYEHECLYHAFQACQRILHEYPKSKVAPKAAYRAACAAHRLSAFNPWWRWEAHRIDLEGKAVSLMHSVASSYPRDPLAKSARKYAKVFEEDRKDAMNQEIWKKQTRFNHFED